MKKEQCLRRISKDIRTVILNVKRYGNLGSTTEMLGVVEFLHNAGYYPALISADPTSQVLKNIYATLNDKGIPIKDQIIGQGVLSINIENQQGELANALFGYADDALVDFKGGASDLYYDEYGSAGNFYNSFVDTRFVQLTPIIDDEKSFSNLQQEFEQYQDVDVPMDLIRVFSLGRIGNKQKREELLEKYEMWSNEHRFNDNIRTHVALFNTQWKTKESENFFATKKIREATVKEMSNNKILGAQFLNERDKFWANFFFADSPAELERLANLPHWQNPTDKWGKIIAPDLVK
ncbi:hypothetical protein MAFF241648_21470 [Ralstonia solanacearum]|nr:hypothetical protein MAFF241648_21470 [Ralstonia solanacearum]